MSIQFGDILKHNNPNYPITDITDVKGGLRSIATFSEAGLISEYMSGAGGSIIPEKYKSGYSLLLETSTNTIYYFSGATATNTSHWTRVGVGGNGSGVTNSVAKWVGNSTLGTSAITDDGTTVTINANLMVIGTTSTVNSENLLVKDPIILLAGSQSGTPTLDSGLFVNRGTGATQAFIWDESMYEFKFISTPDGATVSGNVNITDYSNVRTGVLKVGTSDIDSNDRFLVSSLDGTPSLVVDEIGNSYNKSKGINNTLFGYGAQKNSLYDAGITITSISQGAYNYSEGTYEDVQMTLYSGPAATTYPIVNIEVIVEDNDGSYMNIISSIQIVTNGTGFTSNLTKLTATFGGGTGFYVTIDLLGVFNTSVGYNSLLSNFGKYNTALGANTLYSNTTGGYNTAIGANSLYSNITGYQNIAIGVDSLFSNTIGYFNTTIGYQSLYNTTIGSNNTALGFKTLYSNTTGFQNIAIGQFSLYNTTTSVSTFSTLTPGSGYIPGTYSNVQLIYATGSTAITYPTATIVVGVGGVVSSVTLVGSGSGFKDSTTKMTANNSSLGGVGSGFTIQTGNISNGYSNIGLGGSSLFNNTTGYYNIGIGDSSLYFNTTGYINIGIGYQSLNQNRTGNYNTGISHQSLYQNTTGNYNTGISYRSLNQNTTGNYNTAIGNQSLYGNTTGNYNTAIGDRALQFSKTNEYNVAIGNLTLRYSKGDWNTAVGGSSLAGVTTAVFQLSATFSPGSGYTPGTYSNVALFYKSGTSWNSPNYTLSEFATATIIVGTGGTVSSVTLRQRGVLFTDNTTRFGVQTGTYSYQLGTASGSGFEIGIDSVGTSQFNTAIGYGALYQLAMGGSNVGIGMWAGWNDSFGNKLEVADSSIFIGQNSLALSNNGTNEIVIGQSAVGNGSNTVTLGNDSIERTILKGNVGIGLTGPSTKLHVYGASGSFRYQDTTQGDGYLLTSDSNGVAKWTDPNPQKTINTDTILDNTFNKAIVKVKTSANITIPSTLMENFNCVFRTFTGVTASFIAGGGTTMDAPYGMTLSTYKIATLFKDGSTTTYILEGELTF